MSIGKNVREKRVNQGLTQEELANKVNVHRTMIIQIEKGTKIPTILLSQDIAKALNCTINDLIEVG